MSGSNPYQAPTTAPQRSSLTAHPIGFWFFFWGEFAERCSYYGMKAILLLYMTRKLGFSDAHGDIAMHVFMAICYVLPLVGGYLADNYFGKYRTIVFFSLPYIIGQVIIGVENRVFLVIALTLLAMGSGVIKPNISTLMGLTYDQQRPGNLKLRSDAFAMFYGAINIGAALSSFAMPWLRDRWGYQTAFMFPAGLMAVALLVFASGKRFYAVETVSRRAAATPEHRRERMKVLRRIFGLFIVVAFFWAIFDQSATTWTLFARDHLILDNPPKILTYLGITQLAPDQLQGLNPVFIIILLPPITLFWHLLSRLGINLRPTDKMLIGFLLTTVTMAIMSVAGFLAGEAGRVNVLWEVIPYLVITMAEVCISVVGLELAFAAAPPSMKSFVSACWLLTVAPADLFDAVLTPVYRSGTSTEVTHGFTLAPGLYFGVLAIGMVLVTIAFVLVSRRFNLPVPDESEL